MEIVLSAVPSALAPNSANFGPTAKNPQPKIEIANKLNESFNTDILSGMNDKYKDTNEDYVSTSFTPKSTRYRSYLKSLSSVMNLLIKNDPFPKYENLKISNVAYDKFLVDDFTIKGSESFGIPGQLPLPS
jgi:hypothetical protein